MTRGRYINIGVLVVEKMEGLILFADARFNCDQTRILAFDPQADVEMLQAISKDIQGKLSDEQEREFLVHMMEDSFSNSIQFSDRKTLQTTDPAAEVERLTRLYLTPVPPEL